jgi:tetratricopeptide (TPR) repeat protein
MGAPVASTTITPIQKMTAEKAYDDGAAFLRLNATDKAIEAFDRSLSFDPNNAEAYNAKGVIATKQRNYQDAIGLYNKAIQNDPQNGGYHINLAIAYHLLGRKEDALKAYQKAVQLDSQFQGQLDGYLTSTAKPAVTPSGTSAISPLQKMAADRTYTEGAAFLRLNRLDRALQAFDRALEIDPKNADALNGKGVVETKQRKYQDAIDLYNKALVIEPDNAGMYINLAITYHLLGRKDDAQKAYQKAIVLNPDYRTS